MRALAAQGHPDERIRWLEDRLPALTQIGRSGLSFDFILLSAVWMHVAPGDRSRAFRKLVNLLRPGGCIALTLREGPDEQGRAMHPVSVDEIEKLAREHGAYVEHRSWNHDLLGRDDVRWGQVAVRLADDGAGALPLLRHVILNDDKASTYKLGLLRTLCRIADGYAGAAHYGDDEHVRVPLGLVGLVWLRLYKPLLEASLPQSAGNIGYNRLSFAREPLRRLQQVPHMDLRIGMSFSGEMGAALHGALYDATETIAKMPATYLTYPSGGKLLPVSRRRRKPAPSQVRLDEGYLASFGELRVPEHLWRAMQRFSIWIEPAIVAEWTRLMKFYGERQGRAIEGGEVAARMAWSDPTRDVRVARERAVGLLDRGLHCVWSGRRLTAATLDVDHCFPWSAWPCGDLWNLLPSHRSVNQREKRERLPSGHIMIAAQDRMMSWWSAAYGEADQPLAERFALEAVASLPGLALTVPEVTDVFDAACLQRLRLKLDQQVPEWEGREYL